MGPEKVGAPKGRGTGRSLPSPERKNLESNKRQQKTDPVPPIQRSVSKKGSKNITQSITSFFPGERTIRNQDDQDTPVPEKALPYKANAAKKVPKDWPKLNVAEQTRKRVEAVRAQRETAKKAATAKAAKETEQLSFMGHNEVGTDSSGVSMSGD